MGETTKENLRAPAELEQTVDTEDSISLFWVIERRNNESQKQWQLVNPDKQLNSHDLTTILDTRSGSLEFVKNQHIRNKHQAAKELFKSTLHLTYVKTHAMRSTNYIPAQFFHLSAIPSDWNTHAECKHNPLSSNCPWSQYRLRNLHENVNWSLIRYYRKKN